MQSPAGYAPCSNEPLRNRDKKDRRMDLLNYYPSSIGVVGVFVGVRLMTGEEREHGKHLRRREYS